MTDDKILHDALLASVTVRKVLRRPDMTEVQELTRAKAIAASVWTGDQWADVRASILTGSCEVHSDAFRLALSQSVRAVLAALRTPRKLDAEVIARVQEAIILMETIKAKYRTVTLRKSDVKAMLAALSAA